MRLLLSLLAVSTLLQGAFDSHLWQFRHIVNNTTAPFAECQVPVAVFESSYAQLRDLRLVNANSEIPYVLRVLAEYHEEETLDPRVTNKAALPGIGLRLVLDVGSGGRHNRVTIHTRRRDFKQRVRVETSADGKHWGVVRSDGILFDESAADRRASSLSVAYPVSTEPFLRITIEGWQNPDWVDSASVAFRREIPAQRDLVASLRPHVTEQAGERQTILDFDLGFSRPYDRISFQANEPGWFSRNVTILTSPDRKMWSIADIAMVRKTRSEENLTLLFPEQWNRYVRVQISNNDDRPLSISSVSFEAVRRELVFPATKPGLYWLYSGNANASAPQYDLGSVLPKEKLRETGQIGPMKTNPQYHPPNRPFTERFPWLLTGLLLLLVPAMALVALRMMRQVRT